ncbi:hypothetical protein Sta7437_3094 [Stanieria cyanosphaera PCC 7437]|uniref:Uncharacterized protein n=1 Tax=Stanieria cyanosphaera (strain ATCC 29371 / PCC 7437) TaxID=111780 RepID=K9XWZ4_STAC7|nr:hypothetical protein [Stanieria cyanosphaera]AFZ36606.1 hypothetical protein Sta7437_3094 [Stanieria cyanosphaera PCC 7437]
MIENLIFISFLTNLCLEVKPTLSLLNNSVGISNTEVTNTIYPNSINKFNYLFAQKPQESPWVHQEESPWVHQEESPWLYQEASPWLQQYQQESPWVNQETSPWLQQYQQEKNRLRNRKNNSTVREATQSE